MRSCVRVRVCVSTLPYGPLLVWGAMGETPTWRVLVGAAGIMVTMGVESWIGLRESNGPREESPADDESIKRVEGGEVEHHGTTA